MVEPPSVLQRSGRLVGGHPALDLANTSAWRLDPPRHRDDLADPAVAGWWLRQVLGAAPEPVDPEQVAELIRLRDALIEVLDAWVAGTSPPPTAWALLTQQAQEAIAAAELTPDPPARWSVPSGHPRAARYQLSLAVLELLQSADLKLLRRCAGPGCGWFFVDRTRNHSRRWCASDDCGNRARVRAYSHRRGTSGPRPESGGAVGPR